MNGQGFLGIDRRQESGDRKQESGKSNQETGSVIRIQVIRLRLVKSLTTAWCEGLSKKALVYFGCQI